MKELRKSELSRPWQLFVTGCQRINFGSLEDVEFQDGEPVGRAIAQKTVAFGGQRENGPASEFGDPHAVLRESWQDVITLAAAHPYLLVRRFEIAHGNPLKLHVEDVIEVTNA